jgi:TonB-dependent SusC/RagA subfamily outer membrane receptor
MIRKPVDPRGGAPVFRWPRFDGSISALVVVAGLVVSGCANGAPAQPEPRTRDRTPDDRATMAAAAVGATRWQNLHVTGVPELIQGRFAGVEVIPLANGGTAIHIRGVNTLIGNGDPLYVIDGMETTAGPLGGLLGLNPHDIAKIEVLKDAGAFALYGTRAANGAIIITTKRAQ